MRINEDYSEVRNDELFEFKYNDVEQANAFFNTSFEHIIELEKDYRYYNHVSFGCKLSMIMSGRLKVNLDDYAMVFYPDHSLYANPDLFEGLITTTEASEVKRLLPIATAKQLIAPEWVQMMHVAPESCVIQMKKYYLMDDSQINIIRLHDGIKFISVNVPAVGDNLSIVEKSMRLFGYYLNEKLENIEIGNAEWYTMVFEPKFQPFVTWMLKERHQFLYHVSPSRYQKKIMKNGLVPSSKNDKCDFPDRVYLMMDERNGEVSTNSALRELAIMLMSAFEKTESNEYVDDYKWSLYRIDISKLSNEIRFSFDENFYPLAVFTINVPRKMRGL